MSNMPGMKTTSGQQSGSKPEQHDMSNMPGMNMPAEQQMPGMQMKSIGELIRTSPSNFLPPLGAAQISDSGVTMTLQQLEQMAIEKNPTLRQAQAEIRSAQGRRVQAGFWPNPTVGYSGEEIRGGSLGGGQHGGFIEQRFLLGNKLGLARNVAKTEIDIARIEAEEQRVRVETGVRVGYFRVLSSQESLNLAQHNVELTRANLASSQRFNNIGQTDRSEVLQADIEMQREILQAQIEETRLRADWQALAALIGEPTMPLPRLESRLEQDLPNETADQLVSQLVQSSPASRIAQASIARSQALLASARRATFPDLTLRAGVQQNNERLESSNKKIGVQSFAEAGVQLPIFNRNQGNTAAAQADLERAQAEADRVRLILRERSASMAQSYAMSQRMVIAYREQILPKAQELFTMQLKAWGTMNASYMQVLLSQQMLFDAQREYIRALQQLRSSSLTLRGFLLSDGLEAPTRPGEVDVPVRELNLPNSGRMER